MPRPLVPDKIKEQNALQTSELLNSIQAVLQQQELQIQDLLTEQTARVADVVDFMLRRADENAAPQILEPGVEEVKVAPIFSTASVQESTHTDDAAQRKGTKSKNLMTSLSALPAEVAEEEESDVPLGKRLCNWMRMCCASAGEAVPALLIVTNAIFFGVQADYAVQQPSHEVPEFFRVANLTFTVLFTLELLLRLLTEGRYMFSCLNPDIKWNIMDAVLVMFGLLEEVMTRFFTVLESAPNLSYARILRLLRLVRVARVLRVLRFFSDLRVMILGVLSSLKALMWALILLFFIIYLTAVCILQFVGEHLADNPQDFPRGPLEFVGLSPFSSLLTTCFTLFLTISGGISWGELAPPLMMVNPVVTPILTLYIALATFCVLNIVTGVFVDRSAAMALQDEENMMLEEIQNRKRWIKEIETLFTKADMDGSGNVEWEEFENALTDFRVQLCFKNLGIDIHKVSLEQIWQLIDFDNKGYIDISEFADCLMEMHGVAHSIDIARLRHEQQRTARKLEHVHRLCETNFQSLQTEISRLPPRAGKLQGGASVK